MRASAARVGDTGRGAWWARKSALSLKERWVAIDAGLAAQRLVMVFPRLLSYLLSFSLSLLGLLAKIKV